MSESLSIKTEHHGCLGLVRLNRPSKRNAFTPEMEQRLREALEAFDADPQVKAMLIVGAGGAFSAGIDLAVLSAPGFSEGPYDVRRQHRFNYLPRLAKPVAAAIAGPCYGLAVAIAMLCDLRLVADDCKICMPFTRMGGVAEFGLPVTLTRVVGQAKAGEWLLTGKAFGCEEAVSSGFAMQALPTEDFEARAIECLQAQFQHASLDALMAIKAQLWRQVLPDVLEANEDAGWRMRELRARSSLRVP